MECLLHHLEPLWELTLILKDYEAIRAQIVLSNKLVFEITERRIIHWIYCFMPAWSDSENERSAYQFMSTNSLSIKLCPTQRKGILGHLSRTCLLPCPGEPLCPKSLLESYSSGPRCFFWTSCFSRLTSLWPIPLVLRLFEAACPTMEAHSLNCSITRKSLGS